jgi:hypothetical protein
VNLLEASRNQGLCSVGYFCLLFSNR